MSCCDAIIRCCGAFTVNRRRIKEDVMHESVSLHSVLLALRSWGLREEGFFARACLL